MKKIYSLVMTALATFALGTQVAYAESTVLTPTQTTKIQANGQTAQNADVVLYDANATSWTCSMAKISNGVFTNTLASYEGSPVVLTKFDASSTLEGKTLTKATLKFTSVCTVSGKNSNVQLAQVNTGWDATTATWNSTNTAEILNAVNRDEEDKGVNVKTSAKELSYDVTNYLKESTDNTIGFGIYTYTGREQKISGISLTLEYIDASASANFTVKYVDTEGNELKASETRTESIGQTITLKDEDKASIYSEDKTVKYIYESDDAEGKTIAKDGSTVVTVTFRKAATWSYSFNAIDADGSVLKEGIVKGSNFEGESFTTPYPYALNIDGTLYTAKKLSSDGKGYYFTFNLTEDNQVKEITYSPTTTTDVVFFSEAEDIEGLTKTNNSNTVIRSSNGASAYAAEGDVELVKLPAGKYKLTSVVCDVNSKPNSQWNYLAGNDTIFKQIVTTVNWAQATSDEFTLNAQTPIYLGKGGSAKAGVDLIYIQKTGDVVVETPVVNSLGDFRTMTPSEEGVNVKVMLNDAKITFNGLASGLPVTVLEDATGAVEISNLAEAMSLQKDSVVLNGYLYATWNSNGINVLTMNDDTENSVFEVNDVTIAAKETTVAEALKPENVCRLITIKDAEMAVDDDQIITLTQNGASVEVEDMFNLFEEDLPAKVTSIDGVLFCTPSDVEGEPAFYYLLPIAYESVTEPTVKAKVVDGKEVFLPTEEAINTAIADGWVESGNIRLDNKKGNIDPATGEETSAKVFPGIDLKSGNATKTFVMYITGVDKFSVYGVATGNDTRYLSVNAVNVEDESDSSTGAVQVFKNKTSVNTIELFDATAIYKVTITGFAADDEGKADYSTGADVVMHGIVFNPDAVPSAINGVNANALQQNNDVYSVNGVLVRKAGQSLQGLAKGLYIMGGKKFVVK